MAVRRRDHCGRVVVPCVSHYAAYGTTSFSRNGTFRIGASDRHAFRGAHGAWVHRPSCVHFFWIRLQHFQNFKRTSNLKIWSWVVNFSNAKSRFVVVCCECDNCACVTFRFFILKVIPKDSTCQNEFENEIAYAQSAMFEFVEQLLRKWFFEVVSRSLTYRRSYLILFNCSRSDFNLMSSDFRLSKQIRRWKLKSSSSTMNDQPSKMKM